MSISRPSSKGQKPKAFVRTGETYNKMRALPKSNSQMKDSLTLRVEKLETEMSLLRQRIPNVAQTHPDWLDSVWGSFANDPIYDEAMELGRKYRESLRPKEKTTPKRSARSTK